ncbi:hypothetical protein F4553_001870 [Allocatelliglobosispora scoriae]|uniref:Secreted protein n=1 Tax=Allocatelliglobosispora scoriae TaxID=643052 RepID=A0A841BNT9_9ACTN|nr:hypothetical protein [Allocatelliglobosispora scoriae]MBB5868491.1 hypothetical protein [Allocatelliglobosispora scoriae]
MKKSSTRIRAIPALALAIVLGAVGLPAAPAAASPTLVTCVGTDTAHYTPGLTHTTQTVTVTGQNAASCTSLTHPNLRSVADPYAATFPSSCENLTTNASGTDQLYWNGVPAQSSTWNYTLNVVTVDGTLLSTFSGPITAGVLAGSTLTIVTAEPTIDLLACGHPAGLIDVGGPSSWTITGLS